MLTNEARHVAEDSPNASLPHQQHPWRMSAQQVLLFRCCSLAADIHGLTL